jgi:hypothetical protein
MHHALRQHPDIFMPPEKEIHYFGRDLDPAFVGRRASDREAYLAFFAAAGARRCIGEASPLYLYSESAPSEIAAFCPEARILIMLRDPVELAYSLFCGRRFSSALEPLPERTDSFEMALKSEHLMFLSYRDMARYHAHVARYIATFGRKQIHIIWFEQLARDPVEVFKETCRFLDESVTPDVEAKNSSRYAPVPALVRLLMTPPPMLRRTAKMIVPMRARRAANRFLWTRAVTAPPALDPAIRARLRLEFADDVRRLETLLAVDLSRWLPPATVERV